MKALTIWEPWAWAIVAAGKDVENRTWAPPRALLGERIVIHAGKRVDEDAIDDIEWLIEREVPRRELAPGCLVGTALLVRISTSSASPWFSGPFGWELRDPWRGAPVPCRGAQGLWDVPADVLAKMSPWSDLAAATGAPVQGRLL